MLVTTIQNPSRMLFPSPIEDRFLFLEDLLERISFISDDNGIRQLLCYEHTHTAGLR
jgi:hypothetical protein